MSTGQLDTNLNQSPYFDDFTSNSNYYRVLFKPSFAVQTRELNTIQSISQDQVAKLGNNIFTQGTIVSGCNLNTDTILPYVKLQDNYANGTAVTVTDFIGYTVKSNNGLTAYIKNADVGFISQAPDLNTLYIKYLNSSTSNSAIKSFLNDEVLTVYNLANIAVGQVIVANTISSGSSATTGYSYAVSVDAGVIFQKGLMLNVQPQTLVISKYNAAPDGLSVGFESVENVVTAYQDPSLFDNSQGAANRTAPGADRLSIVPQLVAVNSTSITANSNFFSVVNFVGGIPSIVNQDTSYSVIGKHIAGISNDTNGDFVINPFTIQLKKLVSNNISGAIDPSNLRLEIDKGSAYIDGNKIQLQGKILSVVPKGSAINYAPQQILNTTYGNYVTVQDVGGVFNPLTLSKVSLRSANAYAVSNNLSKGISVSAISAPGSEIGTATLVATTYNSGVPNTANGSSLFYLFNVNMSNGFSFANVASLYSNTAGIFGFADITQTTTGTNSSLSQPNFGQLVYSVKQSAISSLKTSSNTIDTLFTYAAINSVSISTGGTATITIPTYTGGINELPYGAGLLTSTELNQISVVCESNSFSSNISGSATGTSGQANLTGTSTTFTTALYSGALIGISNSTVTEVKEVLSITNNTVLTLTKNLTNSWTGGNINFQYLNGMNIPLAASNTQVNIINSTSFSLNLQKTINTSLSANVFYSIERITAAPIKKKLQTSVFVKIDCSNNAGGTIGPWCLGIPDILSVTNVFVGTTYSTANPSSTAWGLDNGQRDMYYGLGYLYHKGLDLTGASKLLVQVECFTQDVSQGAGFFSIDSYPVDDTGVTSNTIFTQDIPVYFSTASQSVIDLRNAVDFRPYSANTLAYYIANSTLAIANTGIINPSVNTAFVTTNIMLPVPDSQFNSSLQYYMGRYDVIGLTARGTVAINQGTSSENPVPPGNIQDGITLATAYIPPYPSITSDIVDPAMRTNYPRSSLVYHTNKRYTMSDIGNLDARLTQVEYYTALSLLEQSAQNLLLTNASGTTRFQNGMLADPMQDFSIANTSDPAFNIAIDPNASVARPTFTQQLINMVPDLTNSSNVVISANKRLITLPYTSNTLISQPFASHLRNASQDTLYIWNGTMLISPDGDHMPDVTVNPTVTVNLNNYSNWVNLANAWNTEWGTWNEITGVSSSISRNGANIDQTTTTTSKTTSSIAGVSAAWTTSSLGNVVTGVSIIPFCRANLIRFAAYGLKPSTQFWAYFNDTNVTQYCALTDSNWNILSTTLTTDATGVIYGYFYLPPNTFNTGTINFQLVDISNLATQNNVATSMASAFYYGTNLAYTENNVAINNLTGQFGVTTTSQTLAVTNTSSATAASIYNTYDTYNSTQVNNINNVTNVNNINNINNTTMYNTNQYTTAPTFSSYGNGSQSGASGMVSQIINGQLVNYTVGSAASVATGHDPIGQTFYVSGTALPTNVQYIYLTGVDLYFQSKDPVLGVTVDIRSLTAGLPSLNILPFSSVHLSPSQVSVSNNASVKTNISFPAPIMVEAGSSYAIIVTPDGSNPNYNIWTGVMNAKDVLSGAQIYGITNTGEMVLSAQQLTWTPYDSESLKYNLYYANFTSATGSLRLVNTDTEYLSIANTFGTFNINDPVTAVESYNITTNTYADIVTSTGNVTAASNTIYVTTTTGLVNNTTHVLILSTAQQNSFISVVANVVNSTAFTVKNASPFSDSSTSSLSVIPYVYNINGYVSSVNTTSLAISNSTANSTWNIHYRSGDQRNYYIFNPNGEFTTMTSLNDVPYDTIMPKLAVSAPSICAVTSQMRGTSNSATNYTPDSSRYPMILFSSTDFLDKERVVMSKSNEVALSSGAKSLQFTENFYTSSLLTSPFIDQIKEGAVLIYNTVNGETPNNAIFASEVNNAGNAVNKYISTTVTLAPGMEAEDLVVYLGAYYPPNTDIYVYAKLLNQYDPDPFIAKYWTPMYTASSVRSSLTNTKDFNEYLFTFANTPLANTGVANSTAYLNQSNNGVVTYVSPAGVSYATYNTWALKVVLLADASMNVPAVTDVRCIAVSAS